jgi:hypothetical protein
MLNGWGACAIGAISEGEDVMPANDSQNEARDPAPSHSTVHLFPETDSPIDVRPARSFEELTAAYGLVYRCYLGRGYITPHESRLRLTLFNFLPDAITFVGVYQDAVVATLSLLPDSTAGLPMDEIYHDELEQLRTEGRRASEVTMLADRRVEIRRTLPMLLHLMKLVLDYAMYVLRATDLCITINPRHNDFYERYLLFTELGGLRSYPTVRNNPALAKRLDLTTVEERCQTHQLLMRLFFEQRTPDAFFEKRHRFTEEEVADLVERADLVGQATPALVDRLREVYPNLPWEAWLEQ